MPNLEGSIINWQKNYQKNFSKKLKMKYRIHFEIDGIQDHFDIDANTVEDIRTLADVERAKRQLEAIKNNIYSEKLED